MQQNAIKVYNLFWELFTAEVNRAKNNGRYIKLNMNTWMQLNYGHSCPEIIYYLWTFN